MKKAIIGGLVGGFILFIWQFMSWTALQVHGSQNQYMENQEAILACLAEHNIPEGEYFLPNVQPGTSSEEHQKAFEAWEGTPWAKIKYHHKFENNMAFNLMRGFIIDFVAAFLLCWLLIGRTDLDFKRTFLSSIAVGLIGYFTTDYLGNIWYQDNTLPDLIDAVVSWGLVGAFLGWFLNR